MPRFIQWKTSKASSAPDFTSTSRSNLQEAKFRARLRLLALLFLIPLQPDIVEVLHCRLCDFLGMLPRNHDDSVAIGHYNVAGADEHTSQSNRPVDRLDFITSWAEASTHPFVICRNLVKDNFIAVRQTAASDDAAHP